jgi:hypothetical protein
MASHPVCEIRHLLGGHVTNFANRGLFGNGHAERFDSRTVFGRKGLFFVRAEPPADGAGHNASPAPAAQGAAGSLARPALACGGFVV